MRVGLCLIILATTACAQDVVSSDDDRSTIAADARDAADDGGQTTPDAIGPEDDAGPERDAQPAFDASPSDAAPGDAAPADASSGLACHVDRFSSCADPTEVRANNTPSDSTHISGISQGCASGDTFVPANTAVAGRICHTEPADWFDITYVPCDTITMIAQVQLTIDTPCESDAFELMVSGRPCDGTNPDVECTTVGNVQTVRFAIRPGWSVGTLKLGVIRSQEAVVADYQLSYQLAR